jgi:hypothetical protein
MTESMMLRNISVNACHFDRYEIMLMLIKDIAIYGHLSITVLEISIKFPRIKFILISYRVAFLILYEKGLEA